ncbi:MAG: response regulator [Desulfovibrionaceae bacterium]
MTPLRILLADDSQHSLQLLSAYLRDVADEISTCLDGEQAVSLFESTPFDLVLLDVVMPAMDGLTATERIRAIEREQGREPVPVVLLSGKDTPEEIERYARAGIAAFLPKPISRFELIETVRHNTPSATA